MVVRVLLWASREAGFKSCRDLVCNRNIFVTFGALPFVRAHHVIFDRSYQTIINFPKIIIPTDPCGGQLASLLKTPTLLFTRWSGMRGKIVHDDSRAHGRRIHSDLALDRVAGGTNVLAWAGK